MIFDSSVGLGCLLNAFGVPRPNLIIAVVPTLQSGFAAGVLSKLWRAASVLLVKDLPLEAGIAVGMLRPGLLYRMGARFEHLVYRMVDQVVVIGESFRDSLLAKGVERAKVTVIPDWVDLDRIRPRPAEREVRRFLAGVDTAFLVVHTGAMAEKQGLITVLEAAKQLTGERGIYTVLVGNGPTRSRLEAAIEELNLHNVRLVDLQPADYFPKMLAAADALLLNQRIGVVDAVVPSKLLMYMAAGRPVIASVNAASVAAKLIIEAGCGVIVPPEDPIRLAGAIRELAASPDLRELLGRRGRDYAERTFDRVAILDRWDQFATNAVSRAARIRVSRQRS